MLRVGIVGWRGMVGSVLVHRMREERDFDHLEPVIFSCQGGDYTNQIYPKLRSAGWKGYWIDAASALRMNDDAVIVLDPLNINLIKKSISGGIKNYIGG